MLRVLRIRDVILQLHHCSVLLNGTKERDLFSLVMLVLSIASLMVAVKLEWDGHFLVYLGW